MNEIPKTLCPVCPSEQPTISIRPIVAELCPCPIPSPKPPAVRSALNVRTVTVSRFYEYIINTVTRKFCPFK